VNIRGSLIYDIDDLCRKMFGKDARDVRVAVYVKKGGYYGEGVVVDIDDGEVVEVDGFWCSVKTVADLNEDWQLFDLFGEFDEKVRDKVMSVLEHADVFYFYTGDPCPLKPNEWYTGSFYAEISVENRDMANEILKSLEATDGVSISVFEVSE